MLATRDIQTEILLPNRSTVALEQSANPSFDFTSSQDRACWLKTNHEHRNLHAIKTTKPSNSPPWVHAAQHPQNSFCTTDSSCGCFPPTDLYSPCERCDRMLIAVSGTCVRWYPSKSRCVVLSARGSVQKCRVWYGRCLPHILNFKDITT